MAQVNAIGRVLVVDDDARIAEALGELLPRLGYAVEVALSGRDALDRVASFQPHVVLLDLTLPGMTGGEVLDTLRRVRPDIRVVAMTGGSEQSEGIVARGAAACLPKPFDIGVLNQMLRKVIADMAPGR